MGTCNRMRVWGAGMLDTDMYGKNTLCPIEGLVRSGKDQTLILQSYLILSLKLLHEDWIQRLLNQGHRHPWCVHRFGFRIHS